MCVVYGDWDAMYVYWRVEIVLNTEPVCCQAS